MICLNGAYYYTVGRGRVITNEYKYAYLTNCDMPKGNYEFAADGKMIGSKATGEIVNKDGVLYYYESGKGVEKGLVYLDGYYYFAQYGGKLVVNKVQYVYQTNGLLHETNYTFNELGQIIK